MDTEESMNLGHHELGVGSAAPQASIRMPRGARQGVQVGEAIWQDKDSTSVWVTVEA